MTNESILVGLTLAAEAPKQVEFGQAHSKHFQMRIVDSNDIAIISLNLPIQLLINAMMPQLDIQSTIGLNGFVRQSACTRKTEIFAKEGLPIDQLVAQSVSSDMLEDEPEGPQMLFEFRARLLKSLDLVDQAIKSLPKP